MNKPKTFILWGCDDLIQGAVENLLRAHEEWSIIRVPKEEDYEALSQEVEQRHPSAVIITQIEPDTDSVLPLKLVQDHPGLKVLSICLENNQLEVYNRQHVRVEVVEDLISVINS